MLLRKTTWFWKSGLAAISFVLILSISGCSDAPPEENTVSETVIDVQAIQEESEEDADEIISVCIDLYEKAEEENKLADLETIRSIVNRLGENGYSAVDSRNQINMTEPEKVVEFCEKVDAQEEAEITILEISYLGGFVKYDLHTKGGNVDVVRSYYKYENGNMKREVIGNYQAEYWNYTEEGYLMFSGVWFSEELYVLTLSGAEEHTALQRNLAYATVDVRRMGRIVRRRIMEDVKWLLRKCGLLILLLLIFVIVGVICWGKMHEEEQKVAEEVWEPPVEIENSEAETEEAENAETSTESAYWFIPQASDCLISDEEKEQLQSMVLSAADSVAEIYKDIVIADAPSYSSGISEFTNEQRKTVVEQLGRSGLVSVEEDTAMQNHEAVETFYADYLDGRDSMVTVFEVHRDGLIGAVTFIYRKGELQTYYIGVRWKEGGVPEIQGTSVSNVAEIKLTEKGYFIYAYEYVIAHASLRQYWRIEPLPEDCQELTEKYISGLSYVNYNVLVTNWNSSNVKDILMPCMYEDIYRISTGENLKTEDWKIPAEEYERIMTTYFPVSIEQLREYCGYDEGSNSYEYEMIYASPYPPFGEVVDYTKNADGTITLIVDGVWPDYNSDLAFRNTVVVQPFEDGTFRYLSNSIEQIELELPPIARTKG